MKKLLFIVGLSAVFGFGSRDYFGATGVANAGEYSLKTVEQNPIPRTQFFELWKGTAFAQCADAQARHNLTPEQCRIEVNKRSPACIKKVGNSAPDKIGDTILTKTLGRDYLQCVTPYVYCEGIEVKNEQEARKHCQ